MKNKPLTILFDANPIVYAQKSGIGYYSTYLLKSLAELFPDEIVVVGHFYDFLGRKNLDGLPKAPNIIYRPTKLFPGKVANMLRRFGISIPLEVLAKHRGDILLFPNYLTQTSLFNKPIVVAVHDLSFLEHPEFVKPLNLHDLTKYVPQSIKRASLVITISEFIKESITKAYEVPASKILVTPIPPLKITSSKESQVLKLINAPYILFVGNIEPRKNLTNLVEGYNLLPKEVKEKYSLVLAGGNEYKNEKLVKRIGDLKKEGLNIVLTGYIDDDKKVSLYNGASLVVLPSIYEGFGMTILETFYYNKPLAVSDIPVFREIAGDAAEYFDPNTPSSIAKTINAVLGSTQLQTKIKKLGSEKLSMYSWGDIAARLFEKFKVLVETD